MNYARNSALLEVWLRGLSYKLHATWIGNEPPPALFRFTEHEDGRGTVIFCTGAHSYHISFTDTYLGCTASCRTQRPGETWTRGSDLPDGEFSRETFDRIIQGIFAYELVKLTQPVVHETVVAGGVQVADLTVTGVAEGQEDIK